MAEDIGILDEIRGLLDRRPFHPFVIVMSSGDRYEVTERHQLAIGTSVIVFLPPKSASIYLRSNQISSVEALEPSAGA